MGSSRTPKKVSGSPGRSPRPRSNGWASLPRRARRRLGRVLGRAALAVGGPAVLEVRGPQGERSAKPALPSRFVLDPPPQPVQGEWPTPPQVIQAYEVVQSVDAKSNALVRMDVALLAQLNEEYRSKPLVERAPRYDQETLEQRGRKRLTEIHEAIDLSNRRVLELGCGSGFSVWFVGHQFDSEAWGVDVTERNSWSALQDSRVHFARADIGTASPFEPDSFDRVYSVNVLEHVHNPYETLAELYRLLRPGGLAWIRANLHRGPRASHLYRELFLPFPHLLFSDDVIAEYRRQTTGRPEGAAWVNRLTWAEYEDAFRDIGFVTRSLRFVEAPLDEDLYRRFYQILGRYPRSDLARDFFRVVLEKPRGAASR